MTGVRDSRYQPDPAANVEKPIRPWHRRRYRIAAAVGGVAVLSAGAVMATHGNESLLSGARRPNQAQPWSVGGAGPDLGRGGRVVPGVPGTPGGPSAPRGPAGGPGGTKAKASKAPGREPAESPTTTLIVINGVTATMTTSGSMPKLHHTMRVVSARANLTGQRELAWAADTGHPVGDARCTQNFQFTASSAPRVRPTLLLCWRIGGTRTVYTVAVDVDHRPSETASVATIDRVWAGMG
jgi:hypothetical protein